LQPFAAAQPPEVSLAPAALPNRALRTILRMLLALCVSFVFTFTYGTLAAKSRRAEMVLVPLLDVLQSVPVLGYLSFTVVFFVSLAPNRAREPNLQRSSPARPGTWPSVSIAAYRSNVGGW
jgi:NitT/TauT family transport system permease protein